MKDNKFNVVKIFRLRDGLGLARLGSGGLVLMGWVRLHSYTALARRCGLARLVQTARKPDGLKSGVFRG